MKTQRAFLILVAAAIAWLENAPAAAAQTETPLAIQPAGQDQVQVTWPPPAQFSVLEESTDLDSPDHWQAVSEAPEVLGNLLAVYRDATNAASFYRLASRGAPGATTPPDPTGTAPALQPNTFNDLGSSTAFLYTGPNAVQFGVAPGTIVPVRAAVLRGKATKRDKSPVAGVRVAIFSHPEYGYTFTRLDGAFDLAINAGLYTVDFQTVGFCPVQRQVEVPAQDFRTLPAVVLTPLDAQVTQVALGAAAPSALAAGTTQTDADGPRTTRVFLPAGTSATLRLADGTSVPVSSLSIRMTEFTVGTNGHAAMPAPLPPTSAYTFCAEFSADEALNAGATAVNFSQKVFALVDNFLGFPVGTVVPSGYHDRGRATWVPAESGVVIQVLGVVNGLAQIDIEGKGEIAGPELLFALSFTTEELQKIGSTYGVGQSLWRVPLAHFSAWDFNWALGIDPPKSPNTPGDRPQSNPNDTDNHYGAVNYSAQVFEEAVPLVGVPMALHYSSARVPDYRIQAKAIVPLVQMPPKPWYMGVNLQYEVAGKYTDLEEGLVATTTISWDGYDGYGRYVGGTRQARGRIVIEYNPVYSLETILGARRMKSAEAEDKAASATWDLPPLFGAFGNTTFAGGHGGGRGLGIGASFTRMLTIPDHRTIGLGGWSLTPHHSYDPAGHFLYLGNGKVLKQERFANGIGPVPGLNAVPNLDVPLQVAAGPDGTVFFQAYFTDSYSPRLFKLEANGQFAFLSGNSSDPGVVSVYAQGYSSVDGKSALKAAINVVSDMTVGPDGSLYFWEKYSAIGRIDPQGNLHLVLGDGPHVHPPDGTLARTAWAQPTSAGHIAVARDGTVYYDDYWNPDCLPGQYFCGTNYIRKVAPDGRIYTVAGQAGGQWGDNFFDPTNGWRGQMGRKASEAQLTQIQSLAVAPDGTLYVSPSVVGQYGVGGIYKITPDGTLALVLNAPPLPSVGWAAGFGEGDEGKDPSSVPYHSMSVGPHSFQVTSDGSLVFYQYTGFTPSIWRISPGGTLQRLAGRGSDTTISPPFLPSQTGANPLQVTLPAISETMNFTVGPDGSLTLGGSVTSRTAYRISASASGFTGQELQIPSEDASEVYVFNERGLHLRTLNGLTGSTNWFFTYDANNLVTQLRDGNGLTTTVERNGAGQPLAIVGPYGQRTALALDANGFLAGVTNPVGETALLTSTAGGSLTSITGPLQHTYTVAYDTNGLVTRVRDPLGGGLDLAATDQGTKILTTSTTTLGNVEQRQLVLETSGDTTRTNLFADGTSRIGTLATSGAESFANSSGLKGRFDKVKDPRWPIGTWLPALEDMTLPGGLERRTFMSYSAQLSDPNNPFSVISITNRTLINGLTYLTTYDGANRVWSSTAPEGRQTLAKLDAQGRLIHVQAPGQTPVDIVYDVQGRVAEIDDTAVAGLRKTAFNYDSLGRLRTLTDPFGRANQYSYDDAGRLEQLTLGDGQVANFLSDAESRLRSVTPPGRSAHRFDYNAAGLVTNYVPPLVNGLDESVRYAYDADRKLTHISLPDGQDVLFTRGQGARIDQVALGSGPTLTFNYDPATGLPTNITSTAGETLSIGYQDALSTNVTWSGGVTGSVSQTFNADFLPASQSVNGSAISYTYNRDLLLTQAGNLSINRDPATGYITGTALGGVNDQRQFDDRGLLTNYIASVAGTPVWMVALDYDLVGRITNKVETVGGTSRTFGFVYDQVGRLQQVWQDGALSATYTYDANGNRLTRNAEAASYDTQDRVLTYAGASFGWSPNGTLQSRTEGGQVTAYTYDVRGLLTAITLPDGRHVDYSFDPAGRCIGKTVDGVLRQAWLWAGFIPVAKLDAHSQVTARFVFASRPNVPDYIIKGADAFRVLTDERGSVRLVINVADGTIAQQMDYDEFGRLLMDTNPGFQPFGFAGGLHDADAGLVHFGFRDYSPLTGQWTARDPVGFQGGQFSLYSYLGNDPVNFVDPVGLGPWYQAGAGLVSIAGGVLALMALPAITAAGTTAALVAGSLVAVTGALGVVGGTANVALAIVSPGTTAPTSIPGVVAVGAGNSPDAQRAAAVADLFIGARIPTAQFANLAQNVNRGVSGLEAADKTATSYGLTPGSKAPGSR